MKYGLLALALILVGANKPGTPELSLAAAASDGFIVTLTLPSKASLSAPLMLSATILNASGGTVSVNVGERRPFPFVLIDALGTAHYCSDTTRGIGASSPFAWMKNGRSVKESVDLSHFCNLAPGIYKVGIVGELISEPRFISTLQELTIIP